MHKYSKRPKLGLTRLLWPILAIGLVVLLVVGGWGYWHRQWDGHTRFTLIKFTDKLTLNSFDPLTQRGIMVTFPNNLEIESIGGRGKWRADKIQKAGESSWVADSIADYLGITYTAAADKLSWWDSLVWWWSSRDIQWQEIDMENTGLLLKQTTVDGETIKKISPGWDAKARQWFASQIIAQEGPEIRIINTTPVAGLGSHAARVVESIGFNVTAVDSQDEEIENCLILAPKSLLGVGTTLLKNVFDCELQEGQELSLSLGKKYREWWLGN